MYKKVKIIYVIPDYGKFGGIQALATDTAQMLQKKPSLYSVVQYGWHFKEIPLPVRALVRLSPSYLGRHVYELIVAPHFNDKFSLKGDIYHYWSLDSTLPYKVRPYVVSIHGLEILSGNLRGFRLKAYEKSLNGAEAIHSNSNYTKKLLLETFPTVDPKKVIVINPAISKKDKYLSKRPQAGDKYVIGTLTRFVGRKNLPNIVKALTILKNQYGLEFIYYLAGDGPKRKSILRELAKSGIEYKYLGKISDRDKTQKFYPKLDVFVLPPLQTNKDVEGFGIVFLEANASGVPVVASNTGGVSDAVKPNISGLFADPKNPESIAEKIYEILTSKKNYKKSSLDWVEEFSPENKMAQFEAFYAKALKQAKRTD